MYGSTPPPGTHSQATHKRTLHCKLENHVTKLAHTRWNAYWHQNPKKCKINPPKQSHAEFLSNHKTSLVALYLENYAAGIRGHYRRIFRWLATFPTQKNPGIENFNPKKVIRSSPSLEIRSTRAWGLQRLPAGYQILFSLGKVD